MLSKEFEERIQDVGSLVVPEYTGEEE